MRTGDVTLQKKGSYDMCTIELVKSVKIDFIVAILWQDIVPTNELNVKKGTNEYNMHAIYLKLGNKLNKQDT